MNGSVSEEGEDKVKDKGNMKTKQPCNDHVTKKLDLNAAQIFVV